MQDGPQVKKQLERHLGLWSVVAISMGAMMGSGIFVLPLLAAEIAGPWVMLSYLIAGMLVIPAVLSKAELATAMPVSGGTYVYLDRSMGPWMGTIGGLGTWLALSAKTAFALVGLGAYLVVFSDLPPVPFALTILAGLLLLNILGAGKASVLQIIVVVFSTVMLLGFAGWGFTTGQLGHFSPAFPEGAGGLLVGAGFVFVSYGGVTKICSVAEEIRDPSRNIPLGMALSLGLVMVLYCLISFVIVANVDLAHTHHDTTPIATAAENIGGAPFMALMAVVAVIGLISMCNAGVLATSRFPFAMARDGLMPSALKQLWGRFGTPTWAILLTGALLTVLVLGLPVYSLAKLASGFKIFIFCAVNLSVIVLRETGPSWYRPTFRSPLYPWVQIFGILGGLAILIMLGWLPLLGVGAAIVIGSIWYFGYAKYRTDRTSSLTHLFDPTAISPDAAEERPDDGHGRVLVPIFGDEPAAGRLVHLAGAFAGVGAIEILRLEEAAEGIPLGVLSEEDEELRRLARQTEVLAEDLHLDVSFRDMVTHNSKRALLMEAERTGAEWIVMEWPGRQAMRFVVRHPMAWWLHHPPCNLAIFKDRWVMPRGGSYLASLDDELEDSPTEEVRGGFGDIMVLATPGPYDYLAVTVADNLVGRSSGTVTMLLVVPTTTTDAELAEQTDYHRQLDNFCRAPTRSLVVRSDNPNAAIAEATDACDLLIIGAPSERGLRTLLFGSSVYRVADRVRCSVLSLKAPRHLVHHRLPMATAEEVQPYFELGYLHALWQVDNRRDLFLRIAAEMATESLPAAHVDRALTLRELRQNTALRTGVSLSAPVVQGLDQPALGVFTLAVPIDFHSPDRIQVDVCIVVLASPGSRQAQLQVLARVTEMLSDAEGLARLRACQTSQELRVVLT